MVQEKAGWNEGTGFPRPEASGLGINSSWRPSQSDGLRASGKGHRRQAQLPAALRRRKRDARSPTASGSRSRSSGRNTWAWPTAP